MSRAAAMKLRDELSIGCGTARAVRTGIVAQVVRAIGAGKLLFGTDSPLYEPAVFATLLSVAEIGDTEKEQIAHGNAERIILKPRGLA